MTSYLRYARWKIRLQQGEKLQKSVRFFRRSFDHSLLWMIVMEGYYSGRHPMVQECIAAVRSSRMTVRKILSDGRDRGFLEIRADPNARQRKVVMPTPLSVQEYEVMVDRYLDLWNAAREPDVEGEGDETAREPAPKTLGPARASASREPGARSKSVA